MPAPLPERPTEPGDAFLGSAGRQAIDPAEADPAARSYWEAQADAYQAEHGDFLGGADGGFVWGPEGLTEDRAGALGDPALLPGRRILEIGCGAAQCSRWLASRGARPVGVDLSIAQLEHARRAPTPPAVLAATATALPLRTASFDAAFSAYGALQFVADLRGLLQEVRRVLRSGSPWAFSVTHPIRWAFPDSPDAEGLTATGSYFDRTPYVERDASGDAVYAEFHRTLSDYVAALVQTGFAIERLVEPEWPSWNTRTWGGWSPLRGRHLPGTLIVVSRRT